MANGLKRLSNWCYRVVSTPVIAGSLAVFILFIKDISLILNRVYAFRITEDGRPLERDNRG